MICVRGPPNFSGGAGDGTTRTRWRPVRLPGGDGTTVDRTTSYQLPGTWRSISRGIGNTCGVQTCLIRVNGTIWGDHQLGSLGDGTVTDRAAPTRIGATVRS